jgi:hypothetical protein
MENLEDQETIDFFNSLINSFSPKTAQEPDNNEVNNNHNTNEEVPDIIPETTGYCEFSSNLSEINALYEACKKMGLISFVNCSYEALIIDM